MNHRYWSLLLAAILGIVGAFLLWANFGTGKDVGGDPGLLEAGTMEGPGRVSGMSDQSTGADPVEREDRRLVLESGEMQEEDTPPRASGEFWGTVRLANGNPAENYDYWIGDVEGFFDRPTGRMEMFAEEKTGLPDILGVEEEMEPMTGLGSIDAEGVFRIAKPLIDKGYLWVNGPEGVAEAFDLRGQEPGIELRLQKHATLRIECKDLASKDGWKVRAIPTWRDGMGQVQVGQHLRRRIPKSGESLYIQLSSSSCRKVGNAACRISCLAGVEYQVKATGEGFVFDDDPSLLSCPGSRILHLERRFPKLAYRIVDSTGGVARARPWILVRRAGRPSPRPARQQPSEGEISHMDLQAGQVVIFSALFEDGEYLRKEVTCTPGPVPQRITLVRGSGQSPWLLETKDLPDGPDSLDEPSLHTVLSDSARPLSGMYMQDWFEQPAGKAFGMVPDLRTGLRLYFDEGTRPADLLYVDRSGRAWRAKPMPATHKYSLERLPDAPLEVVASKSIYHAQQGRFVLEFQIEVPLRAGKRWLTLERVHLPVAKGSWPTWSKHAPMGWKVRLTIRKGGDVVHLPLGRR